MQEQCDGCELAHKRIDEVVVEVSDLKSFKETASPILEHIDVVLNDMVWMKRIGYSFMAAVVFVFMAFIYPNYEKQNDSAKEIIKSLSENKISTLNAIHKLQKDENENLKELEEKIEEKIKNTVKDLKTHSTTSSKTNYKATIQSVKDTVREIFEEQNIKRGYYNKP